MRRVGSVFLVWMFCGVVQAYIYNYNNQLLKLGHLEYRQVGMFAQNDSPAGDGPSYVHTSVELTRESGKKEGVFQVIFLPSFAFRMLGYQNPDGQTLFCCTESTLQWGVDGCDVSKLGMAIIPSSAMPHTQVHTVRWGPQDYVSQVDEVFEVSTTARHYLLFSSCLNSTGDVSMSGQIIWMNPYGYLPGELYYFIPLFSFLSIAYLVLGIWWLGLCLLYRKDLLHLQHSVSIVILLGLLESLVWQFDYRRFNTVGTRLVGPVISGVVLSSVKRTLSRVLVLVVCMGYGIMKETLSQKQRFRVFVIGGLHLLCSGAYDVMSSYTQTSTTMETMQRLVVFPVALLDAIIFFWILQEISDNIAHLKSRNQLAKLQVYSRFWHILVTTAIVSVLSAVGQFVLSLSSPEDHHWRSLWTFEGVWHVLYFLVLVAIAYLWRPHANMAAYSYSEQLGSLEAEVELATQGSKAVEPAFVVDEEQLSDDY